MADFEEITEGSNIDLREFFYVIRNNWIGITSFTIIFTLLSVLVIYSLESIYRSNVTLLIEADEAQVISIDDVYELGTGNNEYYLTQFEILKSRELSRAVVNSLNLVNDPRFMSVVEEDDGEASSSLPFADVLFPVEVYTESELMNQAVRKFQNSLVVTPIRGTQLVKVGFESTDPDLSAEVANELAKTYIESNLEARLEMTQQAATWLSGRIEGLKEKLEDSERRLQEYREQEDLVELEGVRTLALKELNEITAKLVEARKARTEAENIMSQVNTLSISDIDELSAIPAVLQHNLVQRFKEQEAIAEQKVEELSKRYGYKHPKIIAAKSDLEVAKESTAKQIRKVVQGIGKEYEIAKATEESLTREMETFKQKLQGINRSEYRLNELTREVTVNRQLYDTFFSRIKETSEAGNLQTAHARVVDPAIAPTEPNKPKRFLLSVLAIFVSLIFGVLLSFLKEALDRTIKSRDDVLIKLQAQLLGVLPFIKGKQKSGEASLIFAQEASSSFSESIRTIRTGVVLSGLDNPHKILVVTSSVPGEGKTTVSSNLAAAFGQMGKTLLIDADMRRPSIATNFGIKLSAPGLSNLVAETAEPRECVHRVENLNIDIIPAGVVPPNPLELLSSKRFAAVLSGLEKHYDRIIIDTAPAEVVSDALVLSTFANAVIYVVKADSTNIKIVKSGLTRLREVDAPITGVVLNQVNVEKRLGYGYYSNYYGGYYDYYGYTSDEKK